MKIVLFGMPCAGKDTQGDILCKRYNLPHISTGKIFRDEMASKSELGLKIDSIMKSGKFVDDETTIQVVQKVMGENEQFIFNGFPRNLYQAKWFDKYCQEEDINIDLYIFFDLDEQTARERIKKRFASFKRPEDASEESINTRFDIYRNDTFPGIEYFKEKSNFITINSKLPISKITVMIEDKINGRHI